MKHEIAKFVNFVFREIFLKFRETRNQNLGEAYAISPNTKSKFGQHFCKKEMISKRCLTNLTNYLFLVPLFIKFKFEEIFAKHEIKIWVEFSQFRENQNLGNIFAKKKKKSC